MAKKAYCLNCSAILLQNAAGGDSLSISKTDRMKQSIYEIFGNLLSKKIPNNAEMCKICFSTFRHFRFSRDEFLSKRHPNSKICTVTSLLKDENKTPIAIKDKLRKTENILSTITDQEIAADFNGSIVYPAYIRNGNENEPPKTFYFEEKFLKINVQKYVAPLMFQRSVISTVIRKASAHICKICKRKFITAGKLESHCSAHGIINYKFPCHSCDKKFSELWFYRDHVKNHHNGIEMRFNCIICNEEFFSQSILDNHKSTVHNLTSRPFKCNHCDVAYENVEEIDLLRNHLVKFHKSTKEADAAEMNQKLIMEKLQLKRNKQCSICRTAFSNNELLRAHIIFVHQNQNSCTVCQVVLSSSEDLYEHTQNFKHHQTKCMACTADFSSVNRLMVHFESCHNMSGYSAACEICAKSFMRITRLKEHYKWHAAKAKPSYPCNQCHKTFAAKSGLKSHIAIAHHITAGEFKCSYCHKLFYHKQQLKQHININHAEKISLDHKCSDCGLKFASRSGLARHKLIHVHNAFKSKENETLNVKLATSYIKKVTTLNGGRFQCTECKKVLKSLQIIYRHLFVVHKIRLADKIYDEIIKCEVCDRAVNKHLMRSHMRSHQNNGGLFTINFECKMCVYKCHLVKEMRTHFVTIHDNSKEAEASSNNLDRMREDGGYTTEQKDTFENKLNVCTPCNLIFTTVAEMDEHSQNLHQASIVCKFCNEECLSEKILHEHESQHSEFPCHLCKLPLASAKDFRDHLNNEHTLRPFICEFCEKCLKMSENDTLWHYRYQHFSGLSYQCPHCYGKYLLKRGLDNHIKRNHPTETDTKLKNIEKYHKNEDGEITKNSEFSCRPKKYSSRLQKKVYKCKVCFCHYSKFGSLKSHIKKVHSNFEQVYHKCPHCESKYFRSHSLSCHIKSKHPMETCKMMQKSKTPFKCNYCTAEFVRRSALGQHLNRNHNRGLVREKNYKQFECSFCKKVFVGKGGLTRHMNYCENKIKDLSSKSNEYSSPKNKNSLQLQRKSMRFSCTLCPANYSRTQKLRDHIKKLHPEHTDKSEENIPRRLSNRIVRKKKLLCESSESSDSGGSNDGFDSGE